MEASRKRAFAVAAGLIGWAMGAAHATEPAQRVAVAVAEVNPARRAALATAAAEAKRARPTVTLTKSDLRAPMHRVVPLLGPCQRRALDAGRSADGVLETRLFVDSVAGQGTILSVRGFEGTGALGTSSDFRACVKATLESIVLPPIAGGGAAEITYPMTFAAAPPDNHDQAVVDCAEAAAAAGRWSDALRTAEGGLELTSLDGTFRRRLIATAGVAACHMRDETKARRYYALASATFEPQIRDACARAAAIQLAR